MWTPALVGLKKRRAGYQGAQSAPLQDLAGQPLRG
jgi:hypothetical protein